LSKELVLYGRLPWQLDRSFQFAFGLIAIGAIIVRQEWFYKILAPVSAFFSFPISRCFFIACTLDSVSWASACSPKVRGDW